MTEQNQRCKRKNFIKTESSLKNKQRTSLQIKCQTLSLVSTWMREGRLYFKCCLLSVAIIGVLIGHGVFVNWSIYNVYVYSSSSSRHMAKILIPNILQIKSLYSTVPKQTLPDYKTNSATTSQGSDTDDITKRYKK